MGWFTTIFGNPKQSKLITAEETNDPSCRLQLRRVRVTIRHHRNRGLDVGSWLFIVAVAAIIVLWFAWAPLLTLLAILGVSSASAMLADLMLLVLRVT